MSELVSNSTRKSWVNLQSKLPGWLCLQMVPRIKAVMLTLDVVNLRSGIYSCLVLSVSLAC